MVAGTGTKAVQPTGSRASWSVARTVRVGFVGLAVYMLLWIALFPVGARLLTNSLEAEKQALRRACAAEQAFWPPWNRGQRVDSCADRAQRVLVAKRVLIPESIILKHHKYPSIVLTHHLGAVLWLTAGLAQFGMSRAGQAARRRHRLVGRAYMLSVFLLSAGLVQIMLHDLTAHHDFHSSFPDEVPASPGRLRSAWLGGVYGFVQAWFLFTAGRAWAAARHVRYQEHRKWMTRHVASGFWVVVMRVILFAAAAAAGILVDGFGCEPPGGAFKSHLFDLCSILGMVISFVTAELYLRQTA